MYAVNKQDLTIVGVVCGCSLQSMISDMCHECGEQLCPMMYCTWFVLIADEHLSALRKYCGVTESSSINALASLVVLYLMTHIMREQLR